MHVSPTMHDDNWNSENSQPYLVETGSNVTLTCTAKAPKGSIFQPYEIIWFSNSKHLKEADFRKVKRCPLETCNVTLRGSGVGGKYTCQATNIKGCTYKELEIKVAGESRLIQVSNYYYYINCSVLQGFLPPRNVVSEHT